MDFSRLLGVVLAAAESPAGQKVLTTALDVLVANQALLTRLVEAALNTAVVKLEAAGQAKS